MNEYRKQPSHNSQCEDNYFKAQEKVFYQYLKEHTATASMVELATGIPQKNITRYKRNLEMAGRLWEKEYARCQVTRRFAWYLTTNPDDAPIDNQLKIDFDGV